MSIWKTISNSHVIKFLKWSVGKSIPKKKKKKKISGVIRNKKAKKWRQGTVWAKPKRARTVKGRYKGDDKTTDDVNEAWIGGKSPKKK